MAFAFRGFFLCLGLLLAGPVGACLIFADRFAEGPNQAIDPCTISGQVTGYDIGRPAFFSIVSAEDDSVLVTGLVNDDGSFRADNLDPNKTYFVRVEQSGFRPVPMSPAQSLLRLNAESEGSSSRWAKNTQGLMEEGASLSEPQPMAAGTNVNIVVEAVPGLSENQFVYSWRGDPTVAGSEYSSFVPEVLDIEWLEDGSVVSDKQAAIRLRSEYNIILENPGADSPTTQLYWTAEHASRLYRLIGALPFPRYSNRLGPIEDAIEPTVLILTSAALQDDLRKQGDQYIGGRVEISDAAFVFAEPSLARIDGRRGIFYSNRLFRVLLRMVSNNGDNYDVLINLLRDRYGLTAPSDPNNPIGHLPRAPATCPGIPADCSPGEWALFKPDELIDQIAILEEYPEPLLNLSFPDKELGYRYLLRRRDGVFHPIYRPSMAVAWIQDSYAEYMEHGFVNPITGITTDRHLRYQLIVHEKAHFIWALLLDDANRMDWLRLSGWWYSPLPAGQDPAVDGQCDLWREDPMAWDPPNTRPEDIRFDGTFGHDEDLTDADLLSRDWGSCTTTSFVTAYANTNPSEDFSDSFAMFMVNPDLLRSRAPTKYDFIRDRLMQGSIYLSRIREDLQFEVFNLYPDYTYPGKIKALDIVATGAPEEDKEVSISIEIHALDCGDNESGNCFEGAAFADFMLQSRLLPDGSRQEISLRLHPTGYPEITLGSLLEGQVRINRLQASGWWQVRQITLVDQVGNERQLRQASGDFGWKLFINNPLEDIEAPNYIEESASLVLVDASDSKASPGLLEDDRELILTWRLQEDNPPNSNGPCQASLVYIDGPGIDVKGSFGLVGGYRLLPANQPDGANMECVARWIITPYFATGRYSIAAIYTDDKAGNRREVRLSPQGAIAGLERAPEVEIISPRSDLDAPVLNIDACQTSNLSEPCLRIVATPTNPSNPDGETIVDLYYWAWENEPVDNQSGLGRVDFFLRNPLGVEFGYTALCGAAGVNGQCPTEMWVGRLEPDSTEYTNTRFLCPQSAPSSCDATTPVQYRARVLLPLGSAPGTWGLTQMTVADKERNARHYDLTEIARFDPSETDSGKASAGLKSSLQWEVRQRDE